MWALFASLRTLRYKCVGRFVTRNQCFREALVADGVYPDGLPHPPPSLRARIAIELSVIAAATVLFLYFTQVYQLRSTMMYVGMALIGFALVGFNAQETKLRIWGEPASPEFDRIRRCAINMSLLTIPPLILSLIYAIAADLYGTPESWWIIQDSSAFAPAARRVLNVNFVIAVCLYLPWALLQQTLFQFYLLGRLRALLPFASPLFLSILNGIAYGLVHLPDMTVTAVTILGGIFWSYSYHRDRYVFPIAVSHALLGATFYYWVLGRDLVKELFSAHGSGG